MVIKLDVIAKEMKKYDSNDSRYILLKQLLRDHLSPNQKRVLEFLRTKTSDETWSNTKEISDYCGSFKLNRSYVSAILRVLYKYGLVTSRRTTKGRAGYFDWQVSK